MFENKPFEKLKKLKIEEKEEEPRPSGHQERMRAYEESRKDRGSGARGKNAGQGAKKAPHRNQAQEQPRDQGSEDDIFLAAMQGVTPYRDSRSHAPRPKPEAAPGPPQADPELEALDQLKRLVSGELEFELEFTEEYMQGHIRSLDARLLKKLKRGEYSVEAHLDLHGYITEAAYESVLFFLRESFLQNKRCVMLITGRGRNSPGGFAVIKQAVQGWLTREPLHRIVLAFCTALPRHGGAGAVYVLLRKQRKNQGKVSFDRTGFLD
jgi:DNA-nicking Smr family endonuclease